MLGWNTRWMIPVLLVALAACLGCPGSDTPDQDDGSAAPARPQPAPVEEIAAEPVEEPPPPPTIPQVLLTEALRQTCLVVADDSMPEAELSDLDGEKQSLPEQYGENLTVVFFWTRGNAEFSAMAAGAALEDLQMDVFEPYSEKGVRVVGVNEGDTPEDVKAIVEEAGATFTQLLDPDGALLEKVATEKLPRPYLLDAEGKILWFDLEFSRTTRDSLLQAIQVALGETGQTEETTQEPDES
ncbi:MAG: TlpA family protein disulfide reductase [Planctomycetes bacterium]|nr:TlpA family protein disulfide reductase [Planctomycetota bacterium]